MITSLLSNISEQGFTMLVRLLVLVTALPFHEFAHAFVAARMGDPTAKNMGRLTMNPLKHLDPLGTILILFVGVGYAKPVPVQPAYFKNPRKGMALTAAAGPLSNLLLAYLFTVFYKLTFYFIPMSSSVQSLAGTAFMIFIFTNIALAAFNLLPIPPLDGSRILDLFLSDSLSQKWHALERQYGRFLVLGIMGGLYLGILTKPLLFLQQLIWSLLLFLTGYIDVLAKVLLG